MTTLPYRIMDIRQTADYKLPIIRALHAINARSGGHYHADVIYEHLKTRVIERANVSALWLLIDEEQLAAGASPADSVCGMVTLDQFEDEVGLPLACITRAWCRPGLFRALWSAVKAEIVTWAEQRNCVGLIMQSERDSAWARVLEADGFEVQETMLRAPLHVIRRQQ